MKKIIPLILLILLLLFCLAAYVNGGYYYARGSAADDYSDITLWWGCESTSIDHTDGEDSTASLNGAAINTDAGIIDTNGLDCPTEGDYAALTDSTDGAWPTGSARIGFWVDSNAWHISCGFMRKYHDANEYIKINRIGTGDVRVLISWTGSSLYFDSSGAGLNSGTHFVEVILDDSSNLIQVLVDGVSKGSQTTAWTAFTSGGGIRIGEALGCGETVDAYFDNVMISDDITRDLNALKNLTSYPG